MTSKSTTQEPSGKFSYLQIRKYNKVDHNCPWRLLISRISLIQAAAITNSNVTIANLDYSLAQGDKAIIGILKKMGAQAKICKDKIEIKETETYWKP